MKKARPSSPANSAAAEIFRHEVFEEQVRRNPAALALAGDNFTITYEELNQRANAAAYEVKRMGAQPGDLAAVCLKRSAELVVAMIALQKAGVACLFLDPDWSPRQTDGLIQLAEAKVVLTHADYVGSHKESALQVLCLDTAQKLASGLPKTNLDVACTTEHPESIFCTSGTTGAPKAVVWNFRRQCVPAAAPPGAFSFNRNDRILAKAPVSVTPIVLEAYIPLLSGSCVVLMPAGEEMDPIKILEWVLRHSITVLVAVPTQLRLLMETGRLSECRSLRAVLTFGEAFPPLLEEKFWGTSTAELVLIYGATEAPSSAFRYSRAGKLASGYNLGRPGAGKVIRVLDPEGRELPDGTVGELHVGGAGLARGYFKNPALTLERFIPDPYADDPTARLFRTGDRGRQLADGTIEYLGRDDDLVKIRGYRVELAIVEQALSELPGVNHAAARAWGDSQGHAFLAAYLVPSRGVRPDLGAWREALGHALLPHAVPVALVIMERLPAGPSGKVIKSALPVPTDREAWLDHDWKAPQGPWETKLAALWAQVLEVDRVGRHDTFFELGGTSLRAMSLLGKISSLLKADLPPVSLLQNPSLADLAERVRSHIQLPAEAANKTQFLSLIRKGQSGTPLFVVPGGWGGENEMLVFAALSRKLQGDRPVFAIQSRALDPAWTLPATLEEQASAVFEAVQKVQPTGPYIFLGECMAGVMAAALAARAEALGHPPGTIMLLDARIGPAEKSSSSSEGTNLGSQAHEEPVAALEQSLEIPREILLYYGLLTGYRPPQLNHCIHLVLSSDVQHLTSFQAGWSVIAKSGLVVYHAPGNHDSYIREDAADTVRILDKILGSG